MDIFNIFFDELMQSGPPFFFKVGVRALLPPQKNPLGGLGKGGAQEGNLRVQLFCAPPLPVHSHKRLSLSSAILPCCVFSTVGFETFFRIRGGS